MSRLEVRHTTVYSYARPVSFGPHRAMLRPRDSHDLKLRSAVLAVAPAAEISWMHDVFGNSIAVVDFTEQAERLEFRSEFVVQRTLPFAAEEPHARQHVPFPVVYDPLEQTIAAAYQHSSYPDDVDPLRAWLEEVLPDRDPTDAEGTFAKLCVIVNEQIKYLRRSEKGVQTPEQTLRLGTGSCRDMATLLMDAARVLGLAARFASGYLDCAASIAGRASTHAWTEVYLPLLGWCGYDPTLGEATSLKHVVTGVSNHPRGVMPISGMFHGTAADYLEMSVAVKTETVTGDDRSSAT